MLDYAQCMRDHGIDMPDPQFSADGTGGRLTIQQEPTGSDVPARSPGTPSSTRPSRRADR